VIVSAKGLETAAEASGGAAGVTEIVTRLGTIFLVRINGAVVESATLELFKPLGAQTRVYTKHPTGFEFAIRNDGNVHLVHFGKVTIKNMFGKEVRMLPVDAFFSLPDGLRYREAFWSPSFSMGYYKAHLEIYPGYGNQESERLTKSLGFFVIPWNILIAFALLVVALTLMVRYIRKNFAFTRKK
jgi:hypothetical protein